MSEPSIFGTKHWSPSSLNMWASQPSALILKLMGLRTPVGCAAHRGTASEDGIVHGLKNIDAPIEECQAVGLATFDRQTALSPDPRKMKEREAVPGIIANGVNELRKYGQPTDYQGFVSHKVDGLTLPIIGYYDVFWASSGTLVDIKSQLRLNSEISSAHARQVATYIHGTNYQGRVAYITPAKLGVYILDEPARHFQELVNVAKRLEAFLTLRPTLEELAGLLVPDLDHFYYSDPMAQAYARQTFGFDRSAEAVASSLPTHEAAAA